MIYIENLKKTFGSLTAVDGVSFEVVEGELFGLLGPNGAGKTTTLSMISGLLKPDQGLVNINGFNMWENPKQAKLQLGLVPQEIALYEEFSARENLQFWGGLYELSPRQLKFRINEVLDWVGLAQRSKEAVKRFSGGMKRRLNIAIGLVHKPKVVLMDEPTVGIDPQSRNAILEMIREISREGTTVLFTTHHLEEAESLCERISIMDNGKILETGSVEELAKVVGDEDIVNIKGVFSAFQFNSAIKGHLVKPISVQDGKASVSIPPDGIKLANLVQILGDSRIDIDDLSIQKPNLENVFLKLTGRELRD